MKKKYLSLITGVLSVAAALVFLFVTVYCVIQIHTVARVIQDKSDNLGGIKLVAYAGVGYVFAVLGIIIAGGLACYRGTLCYYYFKIFSSDEKFYDERKNGLIGFSALAAVMFAALTFAASENLGLVPGEMKTPLGIFAALYALIAALPLIERAIDVALRKLSDKKYRLPVPPEKSEIVDELDSLADDVVREMTKKEPVPEPFPPVDNVALNRARLCGEEYGADSIFRGEDYDWPGDFEGRALLAFCCHREIDGFVFPAADAFIDGLREHANAFLYFGKPYDGVADEQQISGHNWYIRGLMKYIDFADGERGAVAAEALRSTVENLYLPLAEKYDAYPFDADRAKGGVSGSSVGETDGWKLSTDVGCAFMCVDGLAEYYARYKDERVLDLLGHVLKAFSSSDFVANGFQTHTTLSCLRGIFKLYLATGEKKYFDAVTDGFGKYVRYGMTLTYENFNWFGRTDSWTEPCAVTDSFILATELYKATGDGEYLTLARRIWFNGLQFCLRRNGGTGPNTCVTEYSPVLKISLYEAWFCCTMRYAEALCEYSANRSLFTWNGAAAKTTDDRGRTFIDDRLVVLYDGKEVPVFAAACLSADAEKKAELTVVR